MKIVSYLSFTNEMPFVDETQKEIDMSKIVIDANLVRDMCPHCKELLALSLGLAPTESLSVPENLEGIYASLGLQAARAFVLGCSDKTKLVLKAMIESGETFSLRDLERRMSVEVGELRGVWTGLTKRVRTITGDHDCALIEWYEETEDDWLGRFMPITRESFRQVLVE